MIYTQEVENMCPVAQGVHHDAIAAECVMPEHPIVSTNAS